MGSIRTFLSVKLFNDNYFLAMVSKHLKDGVSRIAFCDESGHGRAYKYVRVGK